MAVIYPKNLRGGAREPVAVPQVESIERIHEFFKGNQMMMGLGTLYTEAEAKC